MLALRDKPCKKCGSYEAYIYNHSKKCRQCELKRLQKYRAEGKVNTTPVPKTCTVCSVNFIGHLSQCRDCRREGQRIATHKIFDRKCKKCGVTYHGKMGRCKPCNRLKARERYKKKHDKLREEMKLKEDT